MLLHVESGYAVNGNPYHNNMHACDVLQTVNYFITQTGFDVSIPYFENWRCTYIYYSTVVDNNNGMKYCTTVEQHESQWKCVVRFWSRSTKSQRQKPSILSFLYGTVLSYIFGPASLAPGKNWVSQVRKGKEEACHCTYSRVYGSKVVCR